jgi:hypothetical protein
MTRGRVWEFNTRIFIDIPSALLSFRVCHQMSISKSDPALLPGDRIFVKLGFFYGPTCLQDRHFEVQIGKSPGLIKKPKDICHQILYFAKKDDNGFIGEMKELRKYSKGFLSSLLIPKKESLGRLLRVIRRDT